MSGPTKPTLGILAELLAQRRRNELLDPAMSPLARALMEATQRPQTSNPFPPSKDSLDAALRDLFKALPSQSQSGGMFGNGQWSTPPVKPLSTPTFAAPKPKQRATFYSFHYDDVFRVNHVRNAGAILPSDKQRFLTPQDKSLWEKAKNTKPNVLKWMIARGLAGTTVTAVLAGEHTWERPWVRYEIARSLLKGNGLLTVHIDGCECPRNGFGQRGPNPLDYIALGLNRQIYELNANGIWVPFDLLPTRLTGWPKWLPRPSPGHVMPLGWHAPEYDWIDDNGRENLVHWTHDSAKAVGR